MIPARRLLLPLALIATLGAAYRAPADADDVKPVLREPAPRGATAAAATPATRLPQAGDLQLLEVRPRADDEPGMPVFAATPPAPPAPSARPATDTPPRAVAAAELPLPPPAPAFKVMGRYVEDGQTIAFLQYDEQSLVARAGDVLLDHYKVEQVTDSAVTLLNLALDQRQTIEIGASPVAAPAAGTNPPASPNGDYRSARHEGSQ